MLTILVTGGAGYIGSHTCLQLLEKDYEVVVLDNLANSTLEALRRVQTLTNKSLTFIQGDIRNPQLLDQIFTQYSIDAVIHFAGLKAVGESQLKPLEYFDNNISGSIALFNAMKKANVFNLVFSSSATVYGELHESPLNEMMCTGTTTNNYGYTKLIVEQLLEKLSQSDPRWSIALLRYFNPVGAHPSGLIGENPRGIPNNLMPYVTQVAIGAREKLSIFGQDYETIDGTGVRDYIHVMDLANAHLCALQNRINRSGCRAWNIGTGSGASVLQVIKTFKDVNGVDVKYEFAPRRDGDIAICYADNQRAISELGWIPQYGLEEMLRDSWNWQKQNPNGFNEG
ncbi:UDP-glucose 4-epimerase GalE [Acinetobacter sp. ANC 5054]|uniref:UDP-glucose 4-epimerase GalE n=1 Tax=Acinetobacter sp. ANC 5054 TaxID=1977877 RepID=UPI000A35BDD5|nr:UDP-glucose 4-epimerase GalE [Acinetobacter sp. ANC 5054]OTG80190.1 UDP-glucose 4-epimerase GalE [Acinetobacter sp. ANC 5054]